MLPSHGIKILTLYAESGLEVRGFSAERELSRDLNLVKIESKAMLDRLQAQFELLKVLKSNTNDQMQCDF